VTEEFIGLSVPIVVKIAQGDSISTKNGSTRLPKSTPSITAWKMAWTLRHLGNRRAGVRGKGDGLSDAAQTSNQAQI
jgi:hypothetical protein